ncbi:MAG: MmgE/PrpD family protein, partial [Chloroflexi bacterium]|nr:MmgE/PrpD family protein [Chloroflexota bacterium]
ARDTEHIEKAFIFGGMPARNGLTAALMIQAGFTGVWDTFSGDGSFLVAFADRPEPEQLVADLGSRFEVMLTNIKKYCVGFPVQCAMEALLLSVEGHRFGPTDVERIVARLPRSGAHTVNDREMPNISLQYLFSVALLDGDVSFLAAHDVDRMNEPTIRSLRSRISVVGDPELANGEHTAIVESTLKDGRTLTKRVDSFRGKADNPLTTEEVERKAHDLIAPVMGAERATRLIETVRNLEQLPTAPELRPLLALASV